MNYNHNLLVDKCHLRYFRCMYLYIYGFFYLWKVVFNINIYIITTVMTLFYYAIIIIFVFVRVWYHVKYCFIAWLLNDNCLKRYSYHVAFDYSIISFKNYIFLSSCRKIDLKFIYFYKTENTKRLKGVLVLKLRFYFM